MSGFGRPAWDEPKQHTPPLKTPPARFTIAFIREVTAESAAALAKRLANP